MALNAEDELRYAQNEAVMDLQADSSADNLREAFKLFDVDGSGKLDLAEVKDIMTRITGHELTEENALEVINSVDADGDGKLDIEEFVKLFC